MTGADLCVNKPHLSGSYLNHLVQEGILINCHTGVSVTFTLKMEAVYCTETPDDVLP